MAPMNKQLKVIDVDPYDGWTPHSIQYQIMLCQKQHIVINSGRRWGKTTVGAAKFADNIYSDSANFYGYPYDITRYLKNYKKVKPRAEYWAIAPTYGMTETMIEELLKFIPEELILDQVGKKIYLKDGAVIVFKSAEHPKRLVGKGIRGVWLDEASQMKEEVWSGRLSYALADKQGWTIWTTTPDGQNWFYTDVVLKGNYIPAGGEYSDYKHLPEYQNFYGTSLDNDKVAGLQEEIQKMIKEKPKRYVDREIFARFDVFFGQVYEGFSKDRNTVSQEFIDDLIKNKKIKNYYIFKDWGFRNYSVSLLVGETHDGYWYVIDERYKKEIPDFKSSDNSKEENFFDYDKEWYDKYKVKLMIADSAEPKAIQGYKKRGIKRILEAQKDVSQGIQMTASFFHFPEDDEEYIPKLRINKECKNLLRELSAYRWADNGKEEVVKKDDHGCDALRYGIFTLNYKNRKASDGKDLPIGIFN